MEQLPLLKEYMPASLLVVVAAAGAVVLLWRQLFGSVREFATWRMYSEREARRLGLLRQWYEIQKLRKDCGLEPASDDHALQHEKFHGVPAGPPKHEGEEKTDELRSALLRTWKWNVMGGVLGCLVGAWWAHYEVDVSATPGQAIAEFLMLSAIGVIPVMVILSGVAPVPLWRNRRAWLFELRDGLGRAGFFLFFLAVPTSMVFGSDKDDKEIKQQGIGAHEPDAASSEPP